MADLSSTEKQQLLKRANAAFQAGAFVQARELWEEVLAVDPANLLALQGMTNACHQTNDVAAPLAHYETARAQAPDNEHVLALYVDALLADQRPDEAFKLAEEGLERFPHNTHFRIQVGRGRQAFGDLEGAREAFWQSHEADPEAIGPLYQLARLGDARDLEKLAALLAAAWPRFGTLDPDSQLILAFGRATVAEKQGQIDEAWTFYTAGNDVQRRMVLFDEEGFVRNVNLHLGLFGKGEAPGPVDPESGKGIVFIISLPRSGSTLTEQILASHSRVTAIGERTLSFEAFHHWHDRPSAETFAEARALYLDGARNIAGLDDNATDAVIVDKSITNYTYLGFLHALLPAAKFVHMVRAPLDAGVSCYATPFGLSALKWCNDLETIGRVFRRYQKLMKTWCRLWPDDILTLAYEDLIADPETKVRELLAFCDLDWEPACLSFHEGKRQVATASASQVRQPIYQSAKGRAARFEAHIGPLKKTLGRAADPEWHKKLERPLPR